MTGNAVVISVLSTGFLPHFLGPTTYSLGIHPAMLRASRGLGGDATLLGLEGIADQVCHTLHGNLFISVLTAGLFDADLEDPILGQTAGQAGEQALPVVTTEHHTAPDRPMQRHPRASLVDVLPARTTCTAGGKPELSRRNGQPGLNG